jgi:C4-dicarboxylate transporter DctQ subunit
MTLLTFVQVVLRYVFNSGLVWALEATTYLFGWLVLFGMSYGIRTGTHIGVDIFVQKLPPGPRRAVGLAAAALSMLFAVMLLIGSVVYFEKVRSIGIEAEDIPIERWVLIIILPIGFLMLLIRLGEAAWHILRGGEAGLKLADEAKQFIEQFDESADSSERRR